DADRYVDEMVRVAEMLGMPGDIAPRTLGELREYLRGVDGLQVTPGARESLRLILSPPMPLPLRPLWVLPAGAGVASLPRVARRVYGLPWVEPPPPSGRGPLFGLSRVLHAPPAAGRDIRDAQSRP